MIFRARHLQEDRLFECYLAEQGGEPIEPPAAEHLTDCPECNARYGDLRRFMDGLRTEADTELDEVFPPERMRAQQQQIARRVEQLGRHARVISFPGYRPAPSAPGWRSHIAPHWIGAAAAAGLAMGLGLGSLYYPRVPGGAPQTVAINNIAQTVAASSPVGNVGNAGNAGNVANDVRLPVIRGDVNEAFLSELELALERPRTRELVALDELTPHVREIRVQLR